RCGGAAILSAASSLVGSLTIGTGGGLDARPSAPTLALGAGRSSSSLRSTGALAAGDGGGTAGGRTGGTAGPEARLGATMPGTSSGSGVSSSSCIGDRSISVFFFGGGAATAPGAGLRTVNWCRQAG